MAAFCLERASCWISMAWIVGSKCVGGVNDEEEGLLHYWEDCESGGRLVAMGNIGDVSLFEQIART